MSFLLFSICSDPPRCHFTPRNSKWTSGQSLDPFNIWLAVHQPTVDIDVLFKGGISRSGIVLLCPTYQSESFYKGQLIHSLSPIVQFFCILFVFPPHILFQLQLWFCLCPIPTSSACEFCCINNIMFYLVVKASLFWRKKNLEVFSLYLRSKDHHLTMILFF